MILFFHKTYRFQLEWRIIELKQLLQKWRWLLIFLNIQKMLSMVMYMWKNITILTIIYSIQYRVANFYRTWSWNVRGCDPPEYCASTIYSIVNCTYSSIGISSLPRFKKEMRLANLFVVSFILKFIIHSKINILLYK